VATSGGPDSGHDDLDLIDSEFGGHRVAFGDHIRSRLPTPTWQIQDDGPPVAIPQWWRDQLGSGVSLDQSGSAQGVGEHVCGEFQCHR
jgi:hypothetical protein